MTAALQHDHLGAREALALALGLLKGHEAIVRAPEHEGLDAEQAAHRKPERRPARSPRRVTKPEPILYTSLDSGNR